MSAWLLEVLDAGVPELTGARRDELAAAILAAVPGRLIAETISKSAADVLHQRGLADGDLSRELGNNAAMTVIVMLQASVAYDDFESEEEVTHGAL